MFGKWFGRQREESDTPEPAPTAEVEAEIRLATPRPDKAGEGLVFMREVMGRPNTQAVDVTEFSNGVVMLTPK